MSVFKNIRYEIALLKVSPVKFFVSVGITLLIGMLTWISCDGISIVWKTSIHPSFCIPLLLMFVLFILAYLMFGCLIYLGYACSISGEICLKATIAYFALLFWCPLTLLAGVGICGICAVVISLAYLVHLVKMFWSFSLLGSLLSFVIIIFCIYLLYFTVGFTIIN